MNIDEELNDFADLAAPPGESILNWNEDALPKANYEALGERLALAGDLFRVANGVGLIQSFPDGRHEVIRKGADLLPIIVDRVPVQVIKDEKPKGGRIPAAHLSAMLKSESFLARFRTVEYITKTPLYLPDFQISQPGFNDGGHGQRILHLGGKGDSSNSTEAIDRFLDVMAFESQADRTNTVAAALTVLLRNFWPGGKPIIVATATKSHAGKDTLISFAAGLERLTSISYQATNWALERSFVGAMKSSPDTAVMVIENARLDQRERSIASAFVERFATDPEPVLFSTGTGDPVRITNNIVLAISTNFGTVSEDILNRALPIHLTPIGDIAGRTSPIGNPKHEYLPQNRDRIAAELRGMVGRWKALGMPVEEGVRHPFGPWSKVVGGILKANGYTDFLANYGARKVSDDPVRRGLGILGAERPNEWLTASEWAGEIVRLGLTKTVIAPADQGSVAGRTRGAGVVLSTHRDESFVVETDHSSMSLRLEKNRRRFEGGEPQVKYRFVMSNQSIFKGDDE